MKNTHPLTLADMLAAPGVYECGTVAMLARGFVVFIEVEADGTAHQLKPGTRQRDGILSRDGFASDTRARKVEP